MQSFDDFGLDSLQNPVWIYDVIDYQIYWANHAALKLWEAKDLDELRQRDFKSDSSEAVRQTLMGYLRDCEAGRSIESWWRISPKGIDKQVFLKYTGIKIKGGRTAMMIEGLHSELLNHSVGEVGKSSILGLFDNDGTLLSFNPPFKDQFGQDVQTFANLFPGAVLTTELMGTNECQIITDKLLVTQQGERWHSLELNREANSSRFIASMTDIHDRKLNEIKHAKASITDSLTGLLNRRGLTDYLTQLEHRPHTVYYIDLDGFKPINDSYGHSVGDALLQKVARLLSQHVHSEAVCARLGGDEFVLILPLSIGNEARQAIAQDIVKQLSSPIQVDALHRTLVSASVGYAHYPTDVHSPEQVLVCADAAIYMAKRSGRNRFVHYVPGMEDQLLKRSLIVQHLDNAIRNNELNLHYQIVHSKESDSIAGAEALLRWHHPSLGYISPLEVVTAAEETGRIAKLENWVLRRACLDLVTLKGLFGDGFRVGVNISGAHLSQANFKDDVATALAETGTAAKDLVLELTESVMVQALEKSRQTLLELCELGIAFAIDDFGTGYSSLAYLNQIPASFVKIDKAFIDNIDSDPHTVRFIRDLCQNLKIDCLAEGVEDASQDAILNQLGIHYRQGYFYAKPATLEQLAANTNPTC